MLLDIRGLHAGYGAIDVLRGIDVSVDAGELVAVLGSNGAGKSTLLRAISRYDAHVSRGSIAFNGRDLLALDTERTVALGCVHVPEGRQLFSELTVEDNLRLGAFLRGKRAATHDLAAVYDRFPSLAARRRALAFSLSGGEQQMLAIGRALMTKPKLLMLDEPSTGLAPQIVTRIFSIISELARAGTALLLIEQNAYLTLRYADRAYVLENGEIALAGTARDLAQDARVQAIYLGGGDEG